MGDQLQRLIAPMALALMFGSPNAPNAYGLEYRKGKSWEDVQKAWKKARKSGRGKTEFELSMFEVYLADVFKAKKKG